MNRLTFFRAALTHGWGRVRHPVENVSLLLALVALFGLPTTLGFLRDSGLAGLGAGCAIGAVALFFEGAFQLWRLSKADDEQARRLRSSCESWRAAVQHLLDVRAASRPPIPDRGRDARADLVRKQAGLPLLPEPPDDPEARKAAELHNRETVSRYLSDFGISGERLFDALVARQSLRDLDRNRNLVRHPKTIAQIDEAVRIIQLGEFGDLRWSPA
jgi:hypothetical protein